MLTRALMYNAVPTRMPMTRTPPTATTTAMIVTSWLDADVVGAGVGATPEVVSTDALTSRRAHTPSDVSVNPSKQSEQSTPV